MRGWKVGALATAALVTVGAGDASRDQQAFASAILAAHNDARAAVGVPPLAWDDNLAADAHDWASYLADTDRFEHSPWPRGRDKAGEGENLFRGSAGDYSFAEMVGLWLEERRFFKDGAMPDISTSGRWQDAGHYSQIVWRATTRVGCGLATARGQDYLVCRYSPSGNMMGMKAY